MKKSFFVFLLAFLPFSMPAQNAFERPWSSGPLSWSEFRPANDNDEGQSHSQIVWRERKARLKNAGVRYQYTDVYASFNPDFSYVREGFRNPAQLRLNQGIFNINEKYAMEFRDRLDAIWDRISGRAVTGEQWRRTGMHLRTSRRLCTLPNRYASGSLPGR